jgi:hypothetical protein
MLWDITFHGKLISQAELDIPWVYEILEVPKDRSYYEWIERPYVDDFNRKFQHWLDTVGLRGRPEAYRIAYTCLGYHARFPEPSNFSLMTFTTELQVERPAGVRFGRRRAPRQTYRLTPPLEAIYDLRRLPPPDDVGADKNPWLLAVPGVTQEFGVVFQGPEHLFPVNARDVWAMFPDAAVAMDEWFERNS